MAHKTQIGGTAYEISGGRTLINGVGYGIANGRALVDGTGYDISFAAHITFYLTRAVSATLTAEDGMTWGEWIDSDYNNVGAHAVNGTVMVPGAASAINIWDAANGGRLIMVADKIKADYTYVVSGINPNAP